MIFFCTKMMEIFLLELALLSMCAHIHVIVCVCSYLKVVRELKCCVDSTVASSEPSSAGVAKTLRSLPLLPRRLA